MNPSIKIQGKKAGISILGIVFLGIILILVLSYFNISIKAVVESPSAKSNMGYVTDNSESLWNQYLKKPVDYFWNEIWVKIFWASFVDNMERIRDGKPTNIENSAPTMKNF